MRLSALGDVVCALPVLAALREHFPQAKVDWVVEPKAADLLQGHPLLHNVLLFPRQGFAKNFFGPLRKHFQALRRERYDFALDLQGNFKSSLQMIFARAKRKIGFARGFVHDGSHLFVGERVTPPGKRIHRVQKNLSLLEPLGIRASAERLSPPPVDATAAQRVEQFLLQLEIADRPFAILHPATSTWGQDKQWPPERFGALARRISQELQLVPIVTWGPGEKALAAEVAALSNGAARIAFETRSLKELVALIARCSLFVAGDTGALQIASVLGRPTVGIFGPTDPVVYGPIGPRSAVAQPPGLVAPPPERHRASRAKRSELMEQVGVDQVFQLAKLLLENHPGGDFS